MTPTYSAGRWSVYAISDRAISSRNAPASIAFATRKIARAVSYDMPRTLIAGTVKPPVSPRPRARYRAWMEAGRTPTDCASSQISHRALSRAAWSPKTASRTSRSMAGPASAAASFTITLPSSTVTAPPSSDVAIPLATSVMRSNPR